MISVPLGEIEQTVKRALVAQGLKGDQLQTVYDVLMYAQLRDKTQGLIKVVERSISPTPDAKPMQVNGEMTCIKHIVCRGEPGMVVLHHAACIAAEMASVHGVGVVGTSNTSTSTGSIGFYADHIARAGHAAIVMAGSPSSMAVEGGVDPVMGTNPIAIAVPSDEEPLVLDMATAAFTWFGLIEAKRKGQVIPDNVAFGADGQSTTDPADALRGAIRTIAGHKGSGLALLLEMLTGPLVGAGIVGDEGDSRGNLVIAINPAGLGDPVAFKQRVSTLLKRVRNGRLQNPAQQIRFPGEDGDARARVYQDSGMLDIDEDILDKIRAVVAD